MLQVHKLHAVEGWLSSGTAAEHAGKGAWFVVVMAASCPDVHECPDMHGPALWPKWHHSCCLQSLGSGPADGSLNMNWPSAAHAAENMAAKVWFVWFVVVLAAMSYKAC